MAAAAGAANRLKHRLLCADAFEDRVRPRAFGHLHDDFDAVVAALGDDVGRAELARELLALFVSTHRDDEFGSQLPGGQHSQKSDRTVAENDGRRAGPDIGRVGREPAGAEHV
ncbi:MAG: hypothetical protein QM770_01630 [Tepidisphaeraceae bacterium]